jgi:hypothetical protein
MPFVPNEIDHLAVRNVCPSHLPKTDDWFIAKAIEFQTGRIRIAIAASGPRLLERIVRFSRHMMFPPWLG